MTSYQSCIKSDYFVELYDLDDRYTKILEKDEENLIAVLSDSKRAVDKICERFESVKNIHFEDTRSFILSLVLGIDKNIALIAIDKNESRLFYLNSGFPNILMKEENGNLVEIKQIIADMDDEHDVRDAIKTYPLNRISTLFVSNTKLSDLLYKKSHKNAFSKKDVLLTIKNLGSDLLDSDRFAFIFLNNQIGKKLDTKNSFDLQPRMASIAKSEEDIETFLETYFRGSPQNARTLIVVNELLMNAYEHGVLKIDPDTKNRYLTLGSYDEYLSHLEEEATQTISVEISVYKDGVLQVDIDDHGSGFNEELIKRYSTHQYRGRGILLTEKITDALFFRKNGSMVTFFINYKLKEADIMLPSHISEDDILRDSVVLYVEDDTVIRTIFEKSLKKMFKAIYLAADGIEGLEYFNDIKPDLVISDISMPNMNGIEMSRQIRLIDKNVPILLTTAYDQEESIIDAISVGVDRFIPKPLDIQKLQEALSFYAKFIYLHKKQDSAIEKSDIRSKASYFENQQMLAGQKQKLIIHNDAEHIQCAKIEMFYEPIETLSGDIYGVYKLDDEKVLLFVADCMGKGLVASVTSVLAAAFLDRTIYVSSDRQDFNFQRSSHDFIEFIQKYLLPEESLSFSMMLFDFKQNSLEYLSYGMYPMYLKDLASHEVNCLKSMEPPLMVSENHCAESVKIELPEKFSFVVYTDGVCELEHFNHKELLEIFQTSGGNGQTLEKIKTELADGTNSVEDDITIVFAERV